MVEIFPFWTHIMCHKTVRAMKCHYALQIIEAKDSLCFQKAQAGQNEAVNQSVRTRQWSARSSLDYSSSERHQIWTAGEYERDSDVLEVSGRGCETPVAVLCWSDILGDTHLGPRIGNIFREEWVSHAATDDPWASMCQAVDVTGWLGGIGLWRFLLGCA